MASFSLVVKEKKDFSIDTKLIFYKKKHRSNCKNLPNRQIVVFKHFIMLTGLNVKNY